MAGALAAPPHCWSAAIGCCVFGVLCATAGSRGGRVLTGDEVVRGPAGLPDVGWWRIGVSGARSRSAASLLEVVVPLSAFAGFAEVLVCRWRLCACSLLSGRLRLRRASLRVCALLVLRMVLRVTAAWWAATRARPRSSRVPRGGGASAPYGSASTSSTFLRIDSSSWRLGAHIEPYR